jgi:hypothetical protein
MGTKKTDDQKKKSSAISALKQIDHYRIVPQLNRIHLMFPSPYAPKNSMIGKRSTIRVKVSIRVRTEGQTDPGTQKMGNISASQPDTNFYFKAGFTLSPSTCSQHENLITWPNRCKLSLLLHRPLYISADLRIRVQYKMAGGFKMFALHNWTKRFSILFTPFLH